MLIYKIKMGSKSSKQSQSSDDKYTYIERGEIESVGILTYFKDHTSNERAIELQTTYTISSLTVTHTECDMIASRVGRVSNNCRLIGSEITSPKTLCFGRNCLVLRFEIFPHSLYELVEIKTKVSEPELWGIIEDLQIYMSSMMDAGYSCFNLLPRFIYYHEGRIHVLNFLVFTVFPSVYDVKLLNDNFSCILAPEASLQYRMRETEPNYNREKAEMFALGIIVLGLATSTSFDSFFDLRSALFLREVAELNLRKMEEVYSSKLTEFVRACLSETPQDRPFIKRSERNTMQWA